MKSTLALICLTVLFTIKGVSQPPERNTFSMASIHNNFFYKNIDNPISFAMENTDNTVIVLTTDNGSIKKTGDRFMFRANRGNSSTITVHKVTNGDTIKVGRKFFRLKTLPSPIPYVAGLTGSDSISKSRLLNTLGITAKIENIKFDIKVNIKYFEVKIFNGNQALILTTVNGKFSSEMISEFKKCNSGATIIIQNIKADYASEKLRPLNKTVVLTLL